MLTEQKKPSDSAAKIFGRKIDSPSKILKLGVQKTFDLLFPIFFRFICDEWNFDISYVISREFSLTAM